MPLTLRQFCMRLREVQMLEVFSSMVLFACFVNFQTALADNEVIELLPGDPRITGDITKPHTSRWAMTRIYDEESPEQLGVWLDRHEIVEIEGRTLHKFQTDVVWTTGRPRRDIVFWDQDSMETISVELENYNNKGGWAYYVYDEDHLSQIYRREPFGEVFSESRVLGTRVFEPGHGLVFAILLNIQPGQKLRYPYHQRYSDEVKMMTLEAVRREEIETRHFGKVNTLLFEAEQGWKYWAVREPPYVYRLDIPIANNGVDRWELLEYIVE